MATALALAGVVLGWLLSAATEALRRRREGRIAARMVYVELLENKHSLEQAIGSGGDMPAPPRYTAWEGHAPALLHDDRSGELSLAVLTAYSSVRSDAAMVEWMRADQERRMARLRELTTALQGASDGGADPGAAAELRLLARNVESADANLAGYLSTVGSSTLPRVEEALRMLGARTGMAAS
ncbi:hypothetical protein [Blastococcus sp. TF02A-35]|uniref:hypothetical protein n=1 Tax=Blastococcus sp. TF02A-35 TaxID=2559612 RepID=UPI0010736ABA|nr:hypothetical protein [Blastococcus sp. TF02A_35]TFV51653.1 hypothetical protein E4P43_09990 [Blastococcus sp. TF02A_35]